LLRAKSLANESGEPIVVVLTRLGLVGERHRGQTPIFHGRRRSA
jgi:hypothetical protein